MNTLVTLFDWLLTASFRASVLVLGVIAIRWAFRNHLAARARYALWLPVLIVLLTPVLPQSRWSVENVFKTAEKPVSMPQVVHTAPATIPVPIIQNIAPVSTPLDWSKIFLTAWIGIAAAFLLLAGFSFFRTLRRFQRSRLPLSDEWTGQIAQLAREVGLSRAPRVWISSAVTSPAVTGVLRPVLLLPAGFEQDFTPGEARLILQHELTHVKRHDLLLNALLCVLMALHWFNPLLWIAFYRARLDREAACDAQVLENAPPQRRVEYGHALLKAETAFAPLQLSLGFVGLFQRGAALRSRIQSIAHHHPPHPAMKLITLASIGLLTFLGITRAEEPSNVIGKAEFRPGDSIRIANVQRGDGFLTVTADYDLASEPEAVISLHVTATKGDGRSKTAPSQSKKIQKGKGSVTLHHPAVGEGMPHVSFYPTEGGSVFGGVYFGTADEAAASQNMKWSMTGSNDSKTQTNPLEAKLKSIILPNVKFTGGTVEEVVEFLRLKSRELDTSASDAKGISILVRPGNKPGPSITLDLRDVPLGEALRYVAELAGLKMRVEPFAVILAPAANRSDAETQASLLRTAKQQQYDFVKADLGDVLRYLATDAGMKFISLPEERQASKKLVTFSIKDSPFSVLETVCKAHGLMLVLDRNIWHIRAVDDPELIGRSYPAPKSTISTAGVLNDLQTVVEAPSTVKFDDKSGEFYIKATRLQHSWVEAYFQGLNGKR